ncbi:MAG: DUF4055 domain-containing protein [Candidatus Binatia bacterium]
MADFDLSIPMPVDGLEDTHPDYDASLESTQLCRDVIAGADAMRAAGEKYVPALAGEKPAEYVARLKIATPVDIADRTLDAYAGALLQKPPALTLPKQIEAHLDNIDLAGTPYPALRQMIVSERLEVGRVGVMVDWSAEQKRPFVRLFEHEQIRNWQYRIIDGQRLLTQLVLAEQIAVPGRSGFGSAVCEQYRVLELNEAGILVVRVYRRDVDSSAAPGARAGTKRFIETTITPTVMGKPWREIPFVGIPDITPPKAPLLGNCRLGLDFWKLAIDQRHALHVGAAGALVVIGDGEPETPKDFMLGCTRGNRLAAGADAKFIGFECGVLGEIAAEKTALVSQMALLGSRALLAPKRAAETAEAMAIGRESENASLSTISYGLSLGLTRMWRFYARWMGLDPREVSEELNRDFVSHKLTPDEVRAQMEAVQAGYMSEDTFIENLYAGEVSRDLATERERLSVQGPHANPGDGAELADDDEETETETAADD